MIPEKIMTSVASASPSGVGMIAERTTLQLKNAAEKQFTRLIEQGKNIITMQSNLDLLMKRYHVGKSYMSMAVDWYGESMWWTQLGMGIMFVATGALFGAIFSVSALCAILAIGVYSAASFLLLNHYETTLVRDKRFCDDIVDMEKTLGESITSLNTIGQNLNDVLESLSSENSRLAADTTTFEEQIDVLRKQVLGFIGTVNQLGTTNEELRLTNSALNDTVNEASLCLKAAHADLAEKSLQLDELSAQLVGAHIRVMDSTSSMAEIDVKFQQNLQDLCSLEQDIQEHVAILKSNGHEDNRKRDEMTAKLGVLVDATLESNKTTEIVLTRADDCISSTTLLLEEHKRQQYLMDIEDQEIAEEMARQEKDNEILFAQLNAQKAAPNKRKSLPEPHAHAYALV